jgi:hypothetical protein
MFCSDCGNKIGSKPVKFCPACGSKQRTESEVVAPAPYTYVPTPRPASSTNGNGFGVSGLILGTVSLVFGLNDLTLLQGTYEYILDEEIGLLFLLGAAGVTFSAISLARKSKIGSWGLGISIASIALTAYLSTF